MTVRTHFVNFVVPLRSSDATVPAEDFVLVPWQVLPHGDQFTRHSRRWISGGQCRSYAQDQEFSKPMCLPQMPCG